MGLFLDFGEESEPWGSELGQGISSLFLLTPATKSATSEVVASSGRTKNPLRRKSRPPKSEEGLHS